jgi:hypothetical protein
MILIVNFVYDTTKKNFLVVVLVFKPRSILVLNLVGWVDVTVLQL